MILDAQQIKATGALTVGDLVQELPSVTGGVVNPQVNNAGGTGASSIATASGLKPWAILSSWWAKSS